MNERFSPDEFIESSARSNAAAKGESLLRCLIYVAQHHSISLALEQVQRSEQLRLTEVSWTMLADVARRAGLRASVAKMGWSHVMRLEKTVPAIVRLKSGYAMVVRRVEPKASPPTVTLHDPMAGAESVLLLDEVRFNDASAGEVLLLKRYYPLLSEDQPFGIRSIAGRILEAHQVVRDTVIVAFFLGLLSASSIIFWRLLIDRVLYYKAFSTLLVLCLGMLVIVVFETAFAWLRRHFAHNIVRRIDGIIWTDLFQQLLQLPVTFFEQTQTGLVTRDMSEAFKIREFLIEHVFGTMLDGMVLLVFLPIMFFFSWQLTLIVLGVAVLMCLWLIVMLPTLHVKSSRTHQAEGLKGAFLVETIQGIRTVKSLALDARRCREWDALVAQACELRYDESRTTNLLSTVMLPLERLMTSGVLAVAVYMALVTSDTTYVGALVAFIMLAMRVASPLVELASSLQSYDEARIAVAVIQRLINQPKERGRSELSLRPTLRGKIEFSHVRFSYPKSVSPALDDVSFVIPAGTIFGVMGRSGSGKTTVTRLLQGLHSDYQGRILIDGVSLDQIDLDHLRSSIGVVLQDNFLFSGTVASTISAARLDASFDDIVNAARLAGADEFIERLPNGYNTFIQEGSTNLSGGQRQRLAIARALIGNPRVLILDEATSALDAESEAIVNANLMSIAKGRTVIIISHRLSMLVLADSIMVMERGKVADIGRHEELLDRCDIYSHLWHQQHRHLFAKGVTHERAPS